MSWRSILSIDSFGRKKIKIWEEIKKDGNESGTMAPRCVLYTLPSVIFWKLFFFLSYLIIFSFGTLPAVTWKKSADLRRLFFGGGGGGGLDTIVLLLLLCGNTMMAHQHLIVSPFIFFSFVWCPFDGLEWRHSVKRDIPIPVFLFLLSGVSRSNQTPNHRAHLLIVLIDS